MFLVLRLDTVIEWAHTKTYTVRKNKKLNLGIILCLLCHLVYAQVDMQEGFSYLEDGQFAEAEEYFDEVLQSYPDNKTAQLCYARALGLGGGKEEALTRFQSLSVHYPNDYEILLNLAEAYMWNERYGEAFQLYEELLKVNPNHFVANLGFANANAGLKNNDTALWYIDKSLHIEPSNSSAELSKKYILLAISADQRNELSFDSSMMHLDTILAHNPNDREALLNKAVNYLWMDKPHKANKIYQELTEKEIEPLEGTMGLSYTNVLLHQKQKAKMFAETAIKIADNPKVSEKDKIRACVGLVNALGFNRQYQDAHYLIDTLMQTYGVDKPELILARGRMYVWDNETKKGLNYYHFLDTTYTPSFEVKMGLAEAMRGEKKYKDAVSYINQALKIVPNQPDALLLREVVKDEYRPKLTLDHMYASDIGDNFAHVSQAKFEIGDNGRFRSFIHFTHRRLEQVTKENNATQIGVGIGTKFQAFKQLSFTAQMIPTRSLDSDKSEIREDILLDVGVQYDITKNQTLAYNFIQEAHNYNADLLRSGIIMSHHKLIYHFRSPFKVGLYTQFISTTQTDDNLRNLLFASLYYNLNEIPYIKFGINYNVMTHRESYPLLYFSPSYFQATEGFFNINNIERKKNKVIFDLTVAFGTQTTRETDPEFTRRVEAKLGWRFKRNGHLLLYYNTSNASQSTVTGFRYSAFGVQGVYTFGKKIQ